MALGASATEHTRKKTARRSIQSSKPILPTYDWTDVIAYLPQDDEDPRIIGFPIRWMGRTDCAMPLGN